MDFQLNPVSDKPHDDAKLLGHRQIVDALKTFLESSNTLTPLSIAIHGDWGSGKTSIMKTLEKKLDGDKLDIIFFEAWKYEYANPSIGLISELVQKYGNDDLFGKIVDTALTVLAKQYLGASVEATSYILDRIRSLKPSMLSDQLSNIIRNKFDQKKLVIIIDDLDRCDVENALQLLTVTKLFLDIENCICIAAVDFNRLKQAWHQKYRIDNSTSGSDSDGSEYLDKIFQVRIGIPRPSAEQLREYVKTLADVPNEVAVLFSQILPKNPRSIKRVLNLIAFRKNLLDSNIKDISATYWTLLEEILSNTGIVRLYNTLTEDGTSISSLVSAGKDTAYLDKKLSLFQKPEIYSSHRTQLLKFFTTSCEIAKENNIESASLDHDFKILYTATSEALK